MDGDVQAARVERRLREAFRVNASPRYAREGDLGIGDGDVAGHDQAAGRLHAAVSLLADLAERGADMATADQVERTRDHVEGARRLADALINERPLPIVQGSPFVAELMIISDGTRPATLIRHGRVADPAALGPFGAIYDRFLPDADRSVAATGRIELAGRHVGTGVLVRLPAEGRLAILTARHVVAQVLRAQAAGLPANINFTAEFGGALPDRHPVGAPIRQGGSSVLEDDWALLAFETGDETAGPAVADVDFSVDAFDAPRRLAIVSYPGRPTTAERLRIRHDVWRDLFAGVWHVKRLSPAFVIHQPGGGPLVLHDATTTQGSSGGALLSVGTGKVGGIHCGAPDASANWGISAAVLRTGGAW